MQPSAVSIDAYGPPEVLRCGPVALQPPAAGEVRVRTLYAAVNHTDLEIRAGRWPVRQALPFPYVPGVEVVGTVEAVGSAVGWWAPGDAVITMMQGLGGVRAERPGGYAEFVTVDADVLARLPEGVDPLAMAALGLGGVTAWMGLRRLGALAGRRVLVTGAAGGVGSAACAIARALGATVVGIVSRAEQREAVHASGATEVIVSPRDRPAELPARCVDGVLDTVGGRLFGPCAAALKDGGTLCLVGAVAGGDVAFDAWQLIRPIVLTGYSTETLDGASLREAVQMLGTEMARGTLRAPPHRLFPLAEAAAAHRLLEAGGVVGRVLLQA